jgi:hypothetical protein
MVIGFMVGPIMALIGLSLLIGGGGNGFIAALVALLGVALVGGGVRAARAQRRASHGRA